MGDPVPEIVSLGEAMLRLSPPGNARLEQASSLDLHIGGAELSVSIGVSRLGLKASWVTKLPRDALGRRIVRLAREHDVDVSHTIWTEEGRVGIYFVEFGASPRTTSVIYDRKGSVASTLRPGEVDWGFLKGVKLFHTTGITLALSDSCRAATLEAIDAAKGAGCKVSLDINYRSKIWSPEAAEKVLSPLAGRVDLLIASDATTIWGVKPGEPEQMLQELQDRFHTPVIAMSVRRFSSMQRSTWSSAAIADKFYKSSREYEVEVVDRIGSGDSFAAGLIYGYLHDDIQEALDYGDAMAAFKHSIPGDANYATKEEIEELIESGGSFRIKR